MGRGRQFSKQSLPFLRRGQFSKQSLSFWEGRHDRKRRKPRDARPQHSLPLVDVALHFACLVRTIPRTRRDDTAKTEHQGLVTSYRARLEERSGTSGRCPCRTALFRTTRRASRVCLAADWRVLRFTRRRSLCHGHLRAPGVQRRREQPRVESSSHVEFVH